MTAAKAMLRAVQFLAAGVALCVVSGCTPFPQKLPDDPKLDIPDGWQTGQGNADEPKWPAFNWWEQLHSEELNELVRQGTQANLNLAGATARVRQAEAVAQMAGAQLSPTATVGFNGNRTAGIFNGSGTTSASGQIRARYELDFWGLNQANLDSANAAMRASRYDCEAIGIMLTADVVATYLQVLSLRDQLEIADQNVFTAERMQRVIEAQYRAGSATRLDLARQIAAVSAQKGNIPRLRQQERESLSALAILVGEAPQSLTVKALSLKNISIPVVQPGLPSELLLRRPDIRKAEANLKAADAKIISARAAMFPAITLSGYSGDQSSALMSLLHIPNLVGSVTADVTMSVFNRGQLEGQSKLAAARRQEVLAQYQLAILQAFSEVGVALGMVHSLDEQFKLKQMEVEEMNVAYAFAERRYHDGAEDLKTVFDTQFILAQSRLQLVQIKYSQLNAMIMLYKTLGGGWQDTSNDSSSAGGAPAKK